jgi:hypothetical protein
MAINHQVRNQQLDILINDLKLHMGVKTSVSNDTGSSVNVDFSKLLAVENFLTHAMMNKRDIFLNGKLTELGQKYEKLCIKHEDGSPERSTLGTPSTEMFSIYVKLFFATITEEFQKLREAESAQVPRIDMRSIVGLRPDFIRQEGFTLEKDLTGAHKNALNEAIKKFRVSIQSKESKQLINSTRQKATKRFKAAEEHLDELLAKHGVLTCIALDLSFIDTLEPKVPDTVSFTGRVELTIRPDVPKTYSSGVSQEIAQKAQEYFTKLIRNGKNHQALRDMAGYFQKWEFSPARGVYSRTIFVFPQSAVKDLDTLIESIGNYWNNNITDGKGLVERARLSKMPKQLFATACTLRKSDKDVVENFKQRVLFYLTHIDLYYQPVALTHFNNLFSRSEKKKLKAEPGEQPLYS